MTGSTLIASSNVYLYGARSDRFVADTKGNRIADRLEAAFFHRNGFDPPDAEVNSRRNSPAALARALEDRAIGDLAVVLEYQLPLTSYRIDCLLCGQDREGRDNAVIVELKQWQDCEESDGEDLVTWVGGAARDMLHPSAQPGQYRTYLRDTYTAFHEGPAPVRLGSCAYLHNYRRGGQDDALYAARYRGILEASPAFAGDDADELADYVEHRLGGGGGPEVLRRIEQGRYEPRKKLMEHVARVIDGEPTFVLLDEQKVVYEKVVALARAGLRSGPQPVVVVRGGPGTGKSVIALNLMGTLARQGVNAQYATGSRAFTETLRQVIGRRAGVQFKYFNSYTNVHGRAVDVLTCDEAHRIRKSSNSWAGELVCFVDDKQVVRPDEVGSADLIATAAEERRSEVFDFTLQAQFRCAGSDGFVNWVNNTLGIARTANVRWEPSDAFEFRIFGSPQALDAAIREKSDQGRSARMTAGFCWDWSNPNRDGTLAEDVVIGPYCRAWNAKPNTGHLAKGIPKASLRAHDPNGMDQVGCIYTAQGFEFDYVGVIFGPDLRYSMERRGWTGFPEESCDNVVRRSGEDFVELVKNCYRVLPSRGLKGCYVHFIYKETEMFVKSRIASPVPDGVPAGGVS